MGLANLYFLIEQQPRYSSMINVKSRTSERFLYYFGVPGRHLTYFIGAPHAARPFIRAGPAGTPFLHSTAIPHRTLRRRTFLLPPIPHRTLRRHTFPSLDRQPPVALSPTPPIPRHYMHKPPLRLPPPPLHATWEPPRRSPLHLTRDPLSDAPFHAPQKIFFEITFSL